MSGVTSKFTQIIDTSVTLQKVLDGLDQSSLSVLNTTAATRFISLKDFKMGMDAVPAIDDSDGGSVFVGTLVAGEVIKSISIFNVTTPITTATNIIVGTITDGDTVTNIPDTVMFSQPRANVNAGVFNSPALLSPGGGDLRITMATTGAANGANTTADVVIEIETL
jgi:hypothetical protein